MYENPFDDLQVTTTNIEEVARPHESALALLLSVLLILLLVCSPAIVYAVYRAAFR